MTAGTLAPLVVWDARSGDGWPMESPRLDEVRRWLAGQGVTVNDTYRVEVYLVDAPFARVFTYACHPDHPDTGEGAYRYAVDGVVAVNEPYNLPLSELPPENIRQPA